MIVTFCGHSETYEDAELRAWLEATIGSLIQHGADIFYLGGYGGFDRIAAAIVHKAKEIPPDTLPHIFDRFYRADESRTHKDNSYGLGLAIAKGLAEKNGGSIAVTSQDGRTEFTLLLPMG